MESELRGQQKTLLRRFAKESIIDDQEIEEYEIDLFEMDPLGMDNPIYYAIGTLTSQRS